MPEPEILDEHGYKAIYNEALMRMVARPGREAPAGRAVGRGLLPSRTPCRCSSGCIAPASGSTSPAGPTRRTSSTRPRRWATPDLFDGGIYGAVGDVKQEAKRIVLDRILGDIGPEVVRSLVTFGDGPVEIRETHKRGGLTDRRGQRRDPPLRPRRIKAGAADPCRRGHDRPRLFAAPAAASPPGDRLVEEPLMRLGGTP